MCGSDSDGSEESVSVRYSSSSSSSSSSNSNGALSSSVNNDDTSIKDFNWVSYVHKLWRTVSKLDEKEKENNLCCLLSTKRDSVLKTSSSQKRTHINTLDEIDTQSYTLSVIDDEAYSDQMSSANEDDNQLYQDGATPSNKKQKYSYMSLQAGPEALPRHENPALLDRSWTVEDFKSLLYIPSFMEQHEIKSDTKGKPINVFDAEQLQQRSERLALGSGWQVEELHKRVDYVVEHIWRDEKSFELVPHDVVLKTLAFNARIPLKQVAQRYKVWSDKLSKKRSTNSEDESVVSLAPATSDGNDPFLKLADSYRRLYCRRCYSYDCNQHGIDDKAKLLLQTQLALEKERVDFWDSKDLNYTDRICDIMDESPFQDVKELTEAHKVQYRQLYIITGGNLKEISVLMRVPVFLLEDYSNCIVIENPPLLKIAQRKSNASYYSVKNYQQNWYNKLKTTEIHPFFIPCCHADLCKPGTCSCIDQTFCCTKACAWGALSPNFFRGCNCQGRCTQRTCTCLANNRECDPDLCQCGDPCCDPPGAKVVSQRCLNDSISMNRRVHLLIAPSTIKGAGWGCFTKYALSKGMFVEEYHGEMISQDEADRRGQLYDLMRRSTLFTYTSDFVLDASRKANISRYFNHSTSPNLETRTIFVNGDYRIGLFARQDIAPQQELYFDYRYNTTVGNDSADEPALEQQWMKSSQSTGTKLRKPVEKADK